MTYHIEKDNVLVTGGAGFIGSALVRALIKKGVNVVVYDNFLYGHKSNLVDVEDDIDIVRGDILSWKIYQAIKEFNIGYVFHLAAEPYVPSSYDNPEKFFDINIKGTMNLLMACKTLDVKRILHFSSSEVYGTAKSVPMDEGHPTLPLSTYAVSKLAADRMCYVFHHEHDTPVLIARPFNCYGPREMQPYVIPEIISQLVRGNVVRLGNTKARRDFTYVDDTARAAITMMESDIPNGETVNLGSNTAYSIQELAELVGALLKYDDIEIKTEKSRLRPLDVDHLQCNYSMAKKYTGWEPKIDIKEGLRLTIDWYVNNGRRWYWEDHL